MKHTQNTAIHRNASDGSSECLRRPPPMLCITRRNASLPPIGDIRTTLARRSEGNSEKCARPLVACYHRDARIVKNLLPPLEGKSEE